MRAQILYVHGSACGGMAKTSLGNVVSGFAFIMTAVQIRKGQCPWEVTRGKRAV